MGGNENDSCDSSVAVAVQGIPGRNDVVLAASSRCKVGTSEKDASLDEFRWK